MLSRTQKSEENLRKMSQTTKKTTTTNTTDTVSIICSWVSLSSRATSAGHEKVETTFPGQIETIAKVIASGTTCSLSFFVKTKLKTLVEKDVRRNHQSKK